MIINAFKEAEETLEEGFAETVPTVGQSLTQLRNNTIRLIGAFSDATGVVEGLARAIGFLAENLEVLLPILILAGAQLLKSFGGNLIAGLIAKLGFGAGGLVGILTGLKSILAAIGSLRTFTGIGVAGAAAAAVVRRIKEEADGVLETLT